jgi:hypothetical protein
MNLIAMIIRANNNRKYSRSKALKFILLNFMMEKAVNLHPVSMGLVLIKS